MSNVYGLPEEDRRPRRRSGGLLFPHPPCGDTPAQASCCTGRGPIPLHVSTTNASHGRLPHRQGLSNLAVCPALVGLQQYLGALDHTYLSSSRPSPVPGGGSALLGSTAPRTLCVVPLGLPFRLSLDSVEPRPYHNMYMIALHQKGSTLVSFPDGTWRALQEVVTARGESRRYEDVALTECHGCRCHLVTNPDPVDIMHSKQPCSPFSQTLTTLQGSMRAPFPFRRSPEPQEFCPLADRAHSSLETSISDSPGWR